MKEQVLTPDNSNLQAAVQALHNGEVIAYPTEAVFGLGCDPANEAALQHILEIKGRETRKGFILIAAHQAQLVDFLAPLQADWQAQLDRSWPGPVTFVIPVNKTWENTLLTGYRSTLAVRVSQHPTVIELCQQFGGAIVSTSANRSGSEALRDAQSVQQELGHEVSHIVKAPVGALGSPTQIYDIVSGKRLR